MPLLALMIEADVFEQDVAQLLQTKPADLTFPIRLRICEEMKSQPIFAPDRAVHVLGMRFGEEEVEGFAAASAAHSSVSWNQMAPLDNKVFGNKTLKDLINNYTKLEKQVQEKFGTEKTYAMLHEEGNEDPILKDAMESMSNIMEFYLTLSTEFHNAVHTPSPTVDIIHPRPFQPPPAANARRIRQGSPFLTPTPQVGTRPVASWEPNNGRVSPLVRFTDVFPLDSIFGIQ
ncbi:hypothetical protein GGX14DRAFT_604261 [Mycena pura]|uniref:Uncharacterized protein n=1 Tax=Mycena pura TaxID=153505 RepID=A0AAD6VUB0_9AGAR|nr:hypothetical protein GGX14DRAFT_604261 [Mycena pura]